MSGPEPPLEGDRADTDTDPALICPMCGLRWCECGGWTDEDYAMALVHREDERWAMTMTREG